MPKLAWSDVCCDVNSGINPNPIKYPVLSEHSLGISVRSKDELLPKWDKLFGQTCAHTLISSSAVQ